APGYFARQDTRTPVRIGFVAIGVNAVLNVVFVGALVAWEHPAPHAGLALATGLAALVNALLLLRGLRASCAYMPGGGWWGFIARVSLASLAMGAFTAWLAGPLGNWLIWPALE